jgi:processive 1,2-diacylglycerol beta-glucosyltransferase
MTHHPIVVLYCSTGGGHRAAAQVVVEAARARGVAAELVDALAYAPAWFARAYVDAHYRTAAFAPALYGTAYDLSNHRSNADSSIRRTFDRCLSRRLVAALRRIDPIAIVATHFYPPAVLRPAYQAGALRAPVIGVVTDYAAHALWAEPGLSAYCVPKGWAAGDLARHGVATTCIHATGIPVRPAFGWAPAIGRHSPLRVLITSGGHAIGPLSRVLRSFSCIADITITIVCGNNRTLVSGMQRVSESCCLDARVLGFETNMPARMAEADVVVGKPGGLTASECLAAGRPFVMVGAVPGQEARNQAWLSLNDAGIAVPPEAVGRTVAALRDIGALRKMAENARKLGAPDAADRVVDVALACAARTERRLRSA